MNKLALMLSLSLSLAAGVVLADTPVIDARQDNQDDRIDQGEASGELTKREANRLEAQQERIEDKEDRANADGVVTKRERASLKRSENRASRNIAKQKHDGQDRH